MTPSPDPRRSVIGAVLARTLLLGVLWWAISEGRGDWWPGGALTILAAAATSLLLVPPRPSGWRPAGLPGFIPFFLWQSVRGGVDVAARALHPGLSIQPGLLYYRMRLPDSFPRVLFVNVLNVLPGTVSARVSGDTLTVHLLDRRLPARERIVELETRVGRMFGVEIPPDRAGSE